MHANLDILPPSAKAVLWRRVKVWYGTPVFLLALLAANYAFTRQYEIDVTVGTPIGDCLAENGNGYWVLRLSPEGLGWDLGCQFRPLYPDDRRELVYPTFLGFSYEKQQIPPNPPRQYILAISHLILVLLLLPIFMLRGWRRYSARVGRRREARGLCPTCGYDLRGGQSRCPECGVEANRQRPEGGEGSSAPG
jgi:hypothetical protein